VIFIPQCNGKEPTELFLYPNHRDDLQKVLTKIAKASRITQKREREKAADNEKAFKAVLEMPDPYYDDPYLDKE
jgi:hypothetical protein